MHGNTDWGGSLLLRVLEIWKVAESREYGSSLIYFCASF